MFHAKHKLFSPLFTHYYLIKLNYFLRNTLVNLLWMNTLTHRLESCNWKRSIMHFLHSTILLHSMKPPISRCWLVLHRVLIYATGLDTKYYTNRIPPALLFDKWPLVPGPRRLGWMLLVMFLLIVKRGGQWHSHDKLITFIGEESFHSASTQVPINIVCHTQEWFCTRTRRRLRFKESLINQIKGESHLIQSMHWCSIRM